MRQLSRTGGVVLMAVAWSPTLSAHPGHSHDDETAPAVVRPLDPARVVALVEDRQKPGKTGDRSGKAGDMPDIQAAFAAFEKLKAVSTRRDDRFLFVESNGIPDHPLMVGITSWQQQVPLPQQYTGENAWRIPLRPVPATNPATTKNRFLRGAIALAVNGIPIFNPLNNRGDDAYLAGELDEYGGHCGRADDYHYHLAPVHLEKLTGPGQPIAYALDGYPIYGYTEPDGSPVRNLDPFNGHTDAQGRYHYHATKTYPYLNGGFHGEVVERDGQVDPQPRAESPRPALTPLRDAKIVEFSEVLGGGHKLVYDIRGRKGSVVYTPAREGAWTFVFTNTTGESTTETYTPRGGRGQGKRGGREAPPPPRRDEPRPRPGNPPAPGGQPTPAKKAAPAEKQGLIVSSESVGRDGRLLAECTCDGEGKTPAVAWKNAPPGTKAFAVSLWHTAPDREKSYWLVYNTPADSTGWGAGAKPPGTVGLNDRQRAVYDPLCSKGPGVKTYHLTVYALSAPARLSPDKATRKGLLEAIARTTLGEATLDLEYERP
jgi:phosphatidylethanolamine-binding protein (PEBP) family uncharacterized protein